MVSRLVFCLDVTEKAAGRRFHFVLHCTVTAGEG